MEADKPREVHIGYEIHVIHHLLDSRRRADEEKTAPRLTELQHWILRYMFFRQDREIYQRDLENDLKVSRATISSAIKNMEKEGLILRNSVEQDARLKSLKLTEKAMSLEDHNRSRMFRNEAIMREGMTTEEKDELIRLLELVQSNLEKYKHET